MDVPEMSSVHVMCLLREAELNMRTQLLRHLPILPPLLCILASCLMALTLAMKVCLTFRFLGMLHQNNLTPKLADSIDPSRHTCMGDGLVAPPRCLIIIRWTKTKTLQCMGKTPVLPLPAVQGHPAAPWQLTESGSLPPPLSPPTSCSSRSLGEQQ